MKHQITITQKHLAERTIAVEVEAETKEDAILALQNGDDCDVPPFEDPRWKTQFFLQEEEYE